MSRALVSLVWLTLSTWSAGWTMYETARVLTAEFSTNHVFVSTFNIIIIAIAAIDVIIGVRTLVFSVKDYQRTLDDDSYDGGGELSPEVRDLEAKGPVNGS